MPKATTLACCGKKKKIGKVKPGLSDSEAFNKCFPYSIQTGEKVLGSETKDASPILAFLLTGYINLGKSVNNSVPQFYCL